MKDFKVLNLFGGFKTILRHDYGMDIENRIFRKHDYDKNFRFLRYKDIKENIGIEYILRACSKYQYFFSFSI